MNELAIREKWRERAREYRAKYPERHREGVRKSRRKNSLQTMLTEAKHNSKRRKIEFSLTVEDFPVLPTHCPIFDIELDYQPCSTGKRNWNKASLERIDNSEGYTPENTIIVSWRANNLKRDATIDELCKLADFYRYRGRLPK